MKRVAISQPMLFPWPGLFEEMLHVDVWVHFDDVALSKTGFVRRVQIKSEGGPQWLTVPLVGFHRGQSIAAVRLEEPATWTKRHVDQLQRAYERAPFAADMIRLACGVYETNPRTLADLTIASMEAIREYYTLARGVEFLCSSALGVEGHGSERILEIVRRLDGDAYVTGHGAKNYLEHERFEAAGIRVEYMDYAMAPYPQLHGDFTPFVSTLDLVANTGKSGADMLCSGTVDWRTFLSRDKTKTTS